MTLEQIGKYKIVGHLGQGAMGEVYKAHDPILIRDVAIKTISASLAADSDLRKRFYREAQSAARLNHPNIITVYDFGEEHGKIYMAMELLEGTDLKEVIARRALRRLEDKLSIFEQICDGLAFAHAKEVVHRDLKPSNVHILPNGQVKIMDFGLARLGASEMTRAGTVMGTPHYMSPEQVRGERADSRSDIFSLGALFYEVLTYHKAFEADSMHSILFQVLEKQPQSPRAWVPDLPPILVQIVEKALTKDPSHRFANASELREALRFVRDALTSGTVEQVRLPSVSGVRVADATIASDATIVGDYGPEATRPGVTEATRVQGALARDVAPAPQPSQPTTLSGHAPTHVKPSVRPSPAPRRSLEPLYAVGALFVMVAAVAGSYWIWRASHTRTVAVPRTPGAPTEQVGALTRALVVTQLELAARNLADKDYRGAIAQADRALKVDPGNAEAEGIRDKARSLLSELENAAGQARAAFDKGDTEGASRALSRVLAIDPTHPVATQLSKSLNSAFRTQVEDARRNMARSRSAAEKLNADSLATFVEATGMVREAEGLLKRSEFVGAAQRFLQARDGFDRSARTAERQMALPTPLPASVTAPPATVAAAPPPTIPIPPAITPSLPPAATSPAVASPVNEEPAIRRVVADYASAIARKDLALFRTVKPNLSADEEKRLRDAFKAIKSQDVSITISSIKVSGAQATVRVSRQDTVDGKPQRPIAQTFVLMKGPSGWAIQQIGQ